MEKENNINNKLNKIQSKYILKDIFSFISLNKIYSLIRYNKTFQKKFNINLKNYKLLYENNLTKIVVIIKNNKKPTDRYININNKKKKNIIIYM